MKNRTQPRRGKVKSQLLKRPTNSMEKAAHTKDTPKHLRKGATKPAPALSRMALQKMTVPELRDLCLENDIGIHSKLRKGELIEMLVGRHG